MTFVTFDRTLKDILKFTNENAANRPFGGLTVVLGGDFRQILPVVPRGGREDIIDACIKKSSLWEHVKVYKLTQNMRLHASMLAEFGTNKESEFAKWILEVGDGKRGDINGESWEEIPSDILLPNGDDSKLSIVESTYPDLAINYKNMDYLRERAILAPTNKVVKDLNDYIMGMIDGKEVVYRSADSVCKGNATAEEAESLYPEEFLNSLKFHGTPNHELKLKIDVPVMLLRNINQSNGLCNGTRLIITQLGTHFIQAENITAPNAGTRVLIPRIEMSPTDTSWPFTLKRRQYPLAVCFAMTINKSQGQSLKQVGLYLPKQVFCHGQLYVAISRVTSRKGLKIMVADEEIPNKNVAKNIVYPQIFKNL